MKQDKLEKQVEITNNIVNELTFPGHLAVEETTVPVETRGVRQDFDDVEQIFEKIGPEGIVDSTPAAVDHYHKDGFGYEEDSYLGVHSLQEAADNPYSEVLLLVCSGMQWRRERGWGG